MKESKEPNAFVTEAYSLSDKKSILDFYREWASQYDEQMHSLGYVSPNSISRLLAQHLEDRSGHILDLGCGTGLTGQEIAALGFTRIDGIDVSGEMIAVARSRGIYQRLMVGDLNQRLPMPDNSYAAAISSGTFTHGHVGSEPIPEIIRVLEPGGLLACTIHFDLWHNRGFDSLFAHLMAQKIIKCVVLSEGPYFSGGNHEGWFCVYRKQLHSHYAAD